VLLQTGAGGDWKFPVQPDFTAKGLPEAVRLILTKS
jgi:hypothetical protein